MKRIIVALALIGGITAVAFASLSSSAKRNEKKEIKKDQQEKRIHHCRHTCPFS